MGESQESSQAGIRAVQEQGAEPSSEIPVDRLTFEDRYTHLRKKEFFREDANGKKSAVVAYELLLNAQDAEQRADILGDFISRAVAANYREALGSIVLNNINPGNDGDGTPNCAIWFVLEKQAKDPNSRQRPAWADSLWGELPPAEQD
jgi:hypothetical protein